jgi:hypothetical protein
MAPGNILRRAVRPRTALGAPHPRAIAHRRPVATSASMLRPSFAPEATRGCRRRQRSAAANRQSRPGRCQARWRTRYQPRPRPWPTRAFQLGYIGRCAPCGACSLSWTSQQLCTSLRHSGQGDRPPVSRQNRRGRWRRDLAFFGCNKYVLSLSTSLPLSFSLPLSRVVGGCLF